MYRRTSDNKTWWTKPLEVDGVNFPPDAPDSLYAEYGIFYEETPVSPPPVITTLSKLDFLNRFTDEELAGIYTAAKTTVSLEVMLDKFKVAEFIDRADARTVAGIELLETAGLIGVGRAAIILAVP